MEPTANTVKTDGVGPDRHPLAQCTAAIEAALKDVAGLDPLFAPLEVKRDVLVSLSRIGDQVEALRMDVMANASDVAEADVAHSIGSWLAPRLNTERATQTSAANLASDLHLHFPLLRQALSEARANLSQTRVIVRSLNELRRIEGVTAEILTRAEAFLVDECASLTPTELKVLADGILEHLDPDLFDEAEREKLERELRKARGETRLTMRRRGDGTTDIHARVPDSLALRLKTYLEAFTSPRHDNTRDDAGDDQNAEWNPEPSTEHDDKPRTNPGSLSDGAVRSRFRDPATGERLPHDRLLGEAFCALLERQDPQSLPQHGGTATTLVITTQIEALTGQLANGTLPDGTRLAAGDVRRLACTAGIIPVVLDGDSKVLDLGATRRLFSPDQRTALGVVHQTCQAEGCTIPSTWCEAHHRTPWSRGGPTDLDNGMLLCGFHHQRIHDDSYLVKHLANGDVRYRRRR